MNKSEHVKSLTLNLLSKIKELENGLKKIENFEKWLTQEYLLQETNYDNAEKRNDKNGQSYYSARATEAYKIFSQFQGMKGE